MLGKSTISEGKVDGDAVTFTITANLQGNEMKLNYKGAMKGDEIVVQSTAAGMEGQTIEWRAKRQ